MIVCFSLAHCLHKLKFINLKYFWMINLFSYLQVALINDSILNRKFKGTEKTILNIYLFLKTVDLF